MYSINGGLLPDNILLTLCYYHRETRLNAMKRFCRCNLSSHPNVLTFIIYFPCLGDALRSLRWVQTPGTRKEREFCRREILRKYQVRLLCIRSPLWITICYVLATEQLSSQILRRRFPNCHGLRSDMCYGCLTVVLR